MRNSDAMKDQTKRGWACNLLRPPARSAFVVSFSYHDGFDDLMEAVFFFVKAK
jgi:hypothetical protein